MTVYIAEKPDIATSKKGSNISNKGNTKNMIFAIICDFSNTSNMDYIELTVLCVDVEGRTD